MHKICILYAGDHHKHTIIRRQINTFLEAGFDVCVVDQSESKETVSHLKYRHVPVRRLEWQSLVKNTWRIVRRLPFEAIHDRFWKGVLWLRTFSNAVQLAQIALRTKSNYYIADDLQSAWAAVLASKLCHISVIYSAHELESEQGDPTWYRRRFLYFLERRLIRQVDYLVVPNHSRAKVYAERYQMRTDPIVILNCPPASSHLNSNKLRKVLGLANFRHIVLYHGALIPFRALDKLIESATYFEQDIVLVIIGEQGSYFKEALEPIYITQQLQERVYFLPYVPPDEITAYVASADLGVVIYENVNLNNYLCAPTKLYEFIMMKVPVATCNFPELVSMLRQYPVGVTFEPEDPLSIAETVNNYFKESAGNPATFQDALELARERFTWENESLKWLDILKSATARINSLENVKYD